MNWIFVLKHIIKMDMDIDRVERLNRNGYLNKLQYKLLLMRLKRGGNNG